MCVRGMRAITNSNGDSAFPWKIPFFIGTSPSVSTLDISSTLLDFIAFSKKFTTFFAYIIIIITTIIIVVLLNAGLIQSSPKSFAWDLRQMNGGMPHYLGGKILAGNYIIRDNSLFTNTENTFRNMWAVLVSTLFCILCSDGLPEIWLIKF